ncbi:hypothetical protein [Flavobacterium sp. MK4S-17]|uniref:hypothetical protein n=1 Tax=Flavobacterium sp. MK4S-17 TaxID=2543737 RepID=UPI00135773A1|nr:hypothetical protein [Flavobacterium sp. MK4S-17]
MKTNLKKSIALLVLCFTAMAFNQVKAQENYAFAIHHCAAEDGSYIIMASWVFNIATAKAEFSSNVGGETVELFEQKAKSAVQSKGIKLNCNNSFITYTTGPDGDGLKDYIYQIVERGAKGVDYTTANAERRKAIAALKEKYSYLDTIRVIDVTIF